MERARGEYCGIAGLVSDASHHWPDSFALVSGEDCLRYRELGARVSRLARGLVERGVVPGDRVALAIEPGIDLIVALLATLHAGAAYVPLDVDSPRARLGLILADSAPRLVIAGGRGLELPGAVDVRGLEASEGMAPVATAPDACAYVIYTSGTTGVPKGVAVSHHNVIRLFRSTEAWFGFGPGDVVPLFHSIAFDFSVWEVFAALLHGGALVIVPSATRRDPAAFRRLLRDERITVLNQTPSAFFALAAEDERHADSLDSLRVVVFGGEKLPFYKLRRWVSKYGTARPLLVNMYGITETTVHVTGYRVTAEDVADGGRSLIGEPIPDLTLHLLDEQLRPVPPGTPGELWVGGAGVALGYVNRPELTAARFVEVPGLGRLYRSGDVARVGEDGRLEYLVRNDHQVKVRGFRIELGELESALLEHPGVTFATARKLGESLVAFVPPVDLPALRAHARARLPSYMVPRLVAVPALPLTENGKADHTALERLAGAAAAGEAPVGEREELVARLVAEQLGLDTPGRDERYFDLGGDSIRALDLLGGLTAHGWGLTLADLYADPTIRGLAARLSPSLAALPEATAPVPPGAVAAWPMTSLQRGMFWEAARAPGRGVYHDVYSFRVRLPCDEGAIRGAVRLVTQRHPTLRTAFDLAAGVAIVHPDADVPVLFEAGGDDAAATARARTEDYDERKPGLWRVTARSHGPGETQLELAFHHAILDGWSLSRLASELVRAWRAALGGAPAELPDVPDLQGAYVALELAADPAPWDALLLPGAVGSVGAGEAIAEEPGEDAPERPLSHLCTVGGAHRVPAPPVRVAEVDLPPDLLTRLRLAAARWAVPLQAVLLAAHVRVLAAMTGASVIRTGVVTNGRPERAGADRALGLFLNVVPVDLALSPGGTWRDLAERARDALREIMAHRRVPLARLRERGVTFESTFNFVDFHPLAELHRDALVDWERSLYFEANELALVPYFMVDPTGRLVLRVYGRADRFDEAATGRAGRRYGRALAAVAEADDSATLTGRSLLDEAESDALARWSDGGPARPVDPWAAVARWIAERPEAPALEGPAGAWTYGELGAATARLAAEIAGSRRVGILLPRAPEFGVAVMAALRAGVPFVPLDAGLPDGRVAAVLGDAAPDVVLTDGENAQRVQGPRVIRVDRPLSAAPGADAPEPDADAWIVYTSGSTGTPKGVVVTRRNAAAFLGAALALTAPGPEDRQLSRFSPSFDGFLWELLPVLAAGGEFVFTKPGSPVPPRITRLCVTPSYLAAHAPADFPHLRSLQLGGEALRPGAVAAWLAPGRQIFNAYGPTECTVFCTGAELSSADDAPIGRPVPGHLARVVTDLGELAAPGVPGELRVGGAGVARGYLGDPERTRARFSGGEYRTGDRVVWRGDGQLGFLGRRDDQVKVRGWRVELGEIEAVLGGAPGVRAALALVSEEGLAALVAGDASSAARAARERLPAALLPLIVPVDELPVDRNGKADRRAAASLVAVRPRAGALPPRTALEHAVAGLVAEVLGRPPRSVTEDFRAMGGDSLRALDLLARIERRLGARLPASAVAEGATIASIAASLGSGPRSPLVPLADGPGPAWFLVHPAIRTALAYRDLAPRLGRRVVGIEWAGGDEPEGLVALARRYAEAVDAAQPAGPLYLGGWSFGGNVAFEMAAQLEAAGRDVARVVLIDSRSFSSAAQRAIADRLHAEEATAVALVTRLLARVSGRDPGIGYADLRGPGGFERAVAALAAAEVLPEASAGTALRRFVDEVRSVGAWSQGYAPRPVRAPVTLVVAAEAPPMEGLGAFDDEAAPGWAPLCRGGLAVTTAPGAHETMVFPPYASALAEALR